MKHSDEQIRVYCAGPLFNRSEREEMTAIADQLTKNGYQVYLPHRDGMEFRLVLDVLVERNWDTPMAAQFLHEAIFALDVYQLVEECEAMVWNLNGRTPDEGAVSEAAMAWILGKPLIAYQDDVRSLIQGRVNPLLVGMVDFESVDQIDLIPNLLSEAIQNQGLRPSVQSTLLPVKVQRAVQAGRVLWDAMCSEGAQEDNAMIATVVEELFAPNDRSTLLA
ncbi:nucleoside 2-deoxyribosyltransferase [Gimesia fumaroli]|jgi:nucleoside 2-deoxyribosyltransferase|uniref:Nucleoside 2-deoxyribosyltransferase n=1 Tax=Gimesia fumaroli TaxID=2527976 RepID=A0A518IEX1_9PLAN|nr:nucleoside 2-deoxyribosyltransferase [Gimesia fumaroli]QDV51651.1 Nucleoside 2-deoxyribosyltransferase [Gimesia fumaroli]